MNDLIKLLLNGTSLSLSQSKLLFENLIEGNLNDIEISAIVTALKVKGESPAEIAGAVLAFRHAAKTIEKPDELIGDCCGTGGDGTHTVNISTAVSFLAVSCGLKIAKHGNRSVSSKCGSADVLEKLGHNLNQSPEEIVEAISEDGIGFLFAPNFHQGVRYAMPVRNALASRTIFNLIGPLINPAQPDYQLIGVYDSELCLIIAETLKLLSCKSALIVHGSGLDEIAIHGPTTAVRLHNNEISEQIIQPTDYFSESYTINDLAGGDPNENAELLVEILLGNGTLAHNHAIAINTAALLLISDHVNTIQDGFKIAMENLVSGEARKVLTKFIKRSEHVIQYH